MMAAVDQLHVHLSAGGVRGLAIAYMLQNVTGELHKHLFTCDAQAPCPSVHCTGVSVGAILTLALASPEPREAVKLFVEIAQSTHVTSRAAHAMWANVWHALTCGAVPKARVRDIMRELTPEGSHGLFGKVRPRYQDSAVCYCVVQADSIEQVCKHLRKDSEHQNLDYVRSSAAVPFVPRLPSVNQRIDGAAASIFCKERLVQSLNDANAQIIVVVSCRPWVRRLDWGLKDNNSLHDANDKPDTGLFHIRACTQARDGDCFASCHGQQIVNQYMTMACLFDMLAIQATLLGKSSSSIELEGVQLLFRQDDKVYTHAPSGPFQCLLLVAPYQNQETVAQALKEIDDKVPPEATYGLYGTYHEAGLLNCTPQHVQAMRDAGSLMAKVASHKYRQACQALSTSTSAKVSAS